MFYHRILNIVPTGNLSVLYVIVCICWSHTPTPSAPHSLFPWQPQAVLYACESSAHVVNLVCVSCIPALIFLHGSDACMPWRLSWLLCIHLFIILIIKLSAQSALPSVPWRVYHPASVRNWMRRRSWTPFGTSPLPFNPPPKSLMKCPLHGQLLRCSPETLARPPPPPRPPTIREPQKEPRSFLLSVCLCPGFVGCTAGLDL